MTAERDMPEKLLIFDYDGTLNMTIALYKSAVYDALRWLEQDMGIALPYMPDQAKIETWIGVQADDMWNDYMPQLPEEMRKRAIRQVGLAEEKYIPQEAVWFNGVETMLASFRDGGYLMLVLSNCLESYARANWENFRMERWFQAFLACESYANIPKEEIVSRLLKKPEEIIGKAVEKGSGTEEVVAYLNGLHQNGGGAGQRTADPDVIVIGDRGSDHLAASCNGLPFIGCAYGYGTAEELEGAAAIVTDPLQITEAVRRLA